jgi:hypothetical protein
VTLKRPLLMQKAGADADIEYSALDMRALFTGIYNAAGVLNSNTVPPNSDLRVSQRAAGANMSVDIEEGFAVVLGTDVSGQGLYLVQSTATENLVIPAAPVSGTRIHNVVARVRDKLHDGTQTTYDWVLEVIEDTDGSGPPDTPDSALSLAEVTVTSATTSILDTAIADTRENAVMGNGMVVARHVNQDSERPANPRLGEVIWRTDHDYYEVKTSSAWKLLGPLPAPVAVAEGTDLTAISGTSYVAGSPVCGTTFVAPPSGQVFITMTGRIQQSNDGNQTLLSFEVKSGGTIGSGTDVLAASDDRALIAGEAVNSGSPAIAAASFRHLVTSGLTAGSTYNVRTVHKVTGGSGTVNRRALIVEAAP